MAKKSQNESEDVQLELPKSSLELLRSKKYMLAQDYVEIPEVIDGKADLIKITPGKFDQKMQDRLFDFWQSLKENEPKFDIEAKVKKLLIEVK